MFTYPWIVLALDIIPTLFTVVGNGIFFFTIWKTKSAHTPANTLLAFLSVTDLLVGTICQPLFIATMLQSPVPCCTVEMMVYNFVFGITSWTSFLCICLISVDRFFAVYYPYRYRAFATCKRFAFITAAIFAVSLAYTTIDVIFYEQSQIAFLIFLIVFQSSVLLVTIVLYALVYKVICRQRKMYSAQFHRGMLKRRHRKDEKKSKTVAWILMAFVCCSLPYTSYLVQMVLFYEKESKFLQSFGAWVNFLFLFNSAVNPLIYFLKRSDIRYAAKRIILRNFHSLRFSQDAANAEEKVQYNAQTKTILIHSNIVGRGNRNRASRTPANHLLEK